MRIEYMKEVDGSKARSRLMMETTSYKKGYSQIRNLGVEYIVIGRPGMELPLDTYCGISFLEE